MANETEILIVNGVEYTLIDSTAVHTVDSGLSTSSSNPVRNSVITAEVNKKPTLLKFGPYTATLTGEYYTFPFSYIDIAGIAVQHDGIAISFSSSSAFRPNSTLIAFKNGVSLLNGVDVNAYSGTLSDATSIDSNTFVCILPTSGTSSGGTGYIKAATKIADAINALDAAIDGLGTGKTITALSETNGIISATASNIAIAGSQVTSGTIAEARLPYSYVKKSGDTMTGDLIVPAERIANTYYGITFGRTTSTPVETILYTGIKWVGSKHMPVIHITGYAYGLRSPVEFKIGFYIYSGKIGWPGATNMGSWNPSIYLFKYTRDSVDYVAVGLAGSCYFLQLQADVQDEMGKFANIVTDSSAWRWSFLTETGTIPAVDDGTTCVKVPYKADILEAKRHPYWYGTCTTAAGTAAKVVTCTDFVLTAGARISVRFTNGSTSTGTMTLNVNSTGAKTCARYIYGEVLVLANRCNSNDVLEFVYNGTYWITLTPYALRNTFAFNSRPTTANRSLADAGVEYFLATSSMTTGKPPTDAHILNFNWDNGTTHNAQLAIGHGASGVIAGRLFTRGQPDAATWSDWKEIPRLTSSPTNGQIMVSDQSTGLGLIKGGPALDATDTTKFLRHDGSWAEVGGGVAPVEDTDVFLSRAVNFGENKYKFPSLGGWTIAWNQLQASSKPTTQTSNGLTITNNGDGSWTLNGTPTARITFGCGSISGIANHKYYVKSGTSMDFHDVSWAGITTGRRKETICTNATTGAVALSLDTGTNYSAVGTLSNARFNLQIIDLTLALGPTIADYIYSLETATTGAGVNWFKQYFPKSYYPYNAGALISVNPTGAETVGVNQWDEILETGDISTTTGNPVGNSQWLRTKNFTPIFPSTSYYYMIPTRAVYARVFYYDANKNFVSYQGTSALMNATFTTPANAYYFKFKLTVADYGSSYKNDICLNISNPLYNGTYYPYTHRSYPIFPVELRGILKLDANNELYCDGDVRASDGTVTRKYGIVDMGTLAYTLNTVLTGVDRFRVIAYANIKSCNSNTIPNIVCTKFVASDLISANNAFATWVVGQDVKDLYFYTPQGTYASAAAFQTAMSGVYLVYELATPTTESSEALPVPQVVYDGGTESYIDERDVQVPVGQDATYMDATSAIGELMDSGLVPSSSGVSQTSGTFVLGGTGTTITSQWNYVKTGKEVTIYGGFANFMSSSSMTTLFGLPFTPAYSTPVHLSCYVLNVGKFDVVMRLNTDKTMTVECATLTGTNGTVTYLSVPSSTFAYYLIYLSAEIRYITNE